MNKYSKEVVFIILIAIPFIYLAFLWEDLPSKIAIHFDFAGNPDNWTTKNLIIYLLLALGIGTYLLMLLIPKFDPKKKIEQMGGKYYSLRLLMTIFMTIISIYILFSGNGDKVNPAFIIALTGGFDMVFGNYLQTVKPNYFIGIRTPWALENDQTWKKTHRLAGRMWMLAGLIILIFSFIIKNNYVLGILFASITLTIVIVPIIYSYTEFKKLKS